MTDIPGLIERLRASVRFDALNGDHHERSVCRNQMTEAASALAAQQAEVERLREALTQITGMGSNTDPWPPEMAMRTVARAALAGKQP